MRPGVVRLVAVGAVLAGAVSGCVTRTPAETSASPAALPSLADSLPAVPSGPVSPAESTPTPPARPGMATGPGAEPATAPGTGTGTRPGPTGVTNGPPKGNPPQSRGTASGPHEPTGAELRKALLGPGDLSGFQVDGGAGDDAGGGGCAALDTDFSSGASARAEVLLFQSAADDSSYIRERVRHLGESRARAAIDRVQGAPGSCGRYTTTVDQLGAVTVTVDRLGVGRIGDEATALRITMRPKIASVVAVENLVLVRRGGTLIILTHTSLSGIDDDLTVRAAVKAFTKTTSVW
ncbi:hypothetical protein [Actinoplanes sp. CA-252034]|uniref:hypothetical protein n=1 Tax=Actinoplanes sp. CA-252034 TaxID=3239906 RepID=UPI003D99C7DA